MAIPAKGLNQLRTLSGRVDQLSLPYRSYMQITCLEMERARRNMERKSASQRVALIDAQGYRRSRRPNKSCSRRWLVPAGALRRACPALN